MKFNIRNMITNKHFYILRFLLFGLFTIGSCSNLISQSIEISLDDAKFKARENNKKLKISQQDYAIAKSNYEQSRAVILPKISVSNTSSFTNNPLYAFGYKLLQQSVTVADFNPNNLNDPGQVENFNTRIELLQPLINMDGWKKRKASNLQLQASNLQMERTSDYLELEVVKTFMELQLAYKSVESIEKAKETASENEKVAKNHLEQGLIQNADYLNVQIRVTEIKNQLQYANSNVNNISDYLSFLIGGNKQLIYHPNSELKLQSIDINENSILNIERSDIQSIQFEIAAQEQMLKSSKLSFVPKANAFANYEWNDSEVFGFNSNNYLFGLQLSWDIFSGYKNIGKIHYEKAQLEKVNLKKENYIAKSELELNKAKREFKNAKNNVNLSKLALDQSKKALKIKANRFEQGLEKTTDLLFSENQYQQKELDYFQSIFNYNYTLAYLNFLTK